MIIRKTVILLLLCLGFVFGQDHDSLRSIIYGGDDSASSFRAALLLGKTFLDNGKTDSSEKYLSLVLKDGFESLEERQKFEAMMRYGFLKIQKLRLPEADSLFQLVAGKVVLNDTQKVVLGLGRATIYQKTGQWDSIRAVLEPLSSLVKKLDIPAYTVDFHNSMGIYYKGKGDHYADFEELLKAKEALTPDLVRRQLMINLNLTSIYLDIHAYEEAYELYKQNLALAREHKLPAEIMYAYYGIASFYQKSEQYEKLRGVWRKAIHLKDSSGFSTSFGFMHLYMGKALMKLGMYDSALWYMDKALAISQKQEEAYIVGEIFLEMGKVYMAKGDTLIAGEFLRRGLALEDSHVTEASLNLARVYAFEGNYEEASEILRRTWEKIEESDGKNVVYKVTGNLLKHKFEEEKELEEILNRERLQQQKVNFGILVIFLVMPIAMYIIFLQSQHRYNLEELNRKLTQKNEELQQFTYICSHDLKEPVRNVSTFTGLIEYKLAGEDLEESVEDYFSRIHSGINTLSTVISSLKAFTEIEGKKEGAFQAEEVVLKDVFEEARGNLALFIEENNAAVYLEEGTKPEERFVSSKYGLILVLQNLIHNGIKYNHSERPEVGVGLGRRGGRTFVQVTDNGIGIDEASIEYIFEPFETSDKRPKGNSSGLGLAISKKIVEACGGEIQVESEVGRGSRFRIHL